MKGFLATLLFLGTVDVQAAADESQAIAGIVANMVKPAALNAVRTSKALDVTTPEDADDECPTERSACMSNSQCVSCFLAFSTVGCDDSPSDCGELGSSYCCMFTGTDAECGENAALIAYTECLADARCDFGDDLCSGAGSIFSRHPARAVGATLAVGIVGLLGSGLGIVGA